MQFVNEQDRVLGAANLVHHRLDPFLELAAVLGAGNHHGQVEHHDAAFPQQVGHLAVDDHLGEALDDRRLPHARLAEQNRVVLLAAAENLNDAFDLVGTADDRIEFLLAGQLGQVATEAVQCRSLALARLGRPAGPLAGLGPLESVPEQVEHLFANILEFQAEVHQHLGRHSLLFPQQPQQQVLGPHVVVVEVLGFLESVLDHLLRPRRLGQFAHGDHVGTRLDNLLDFKPNLAEIDVEVFQHVGGNTRAFLDQPQQNVLGADVLVVEPLGLLVGQLHHLACPIGETFVHLSLSVLVGMSSAIVGHRRW